MVPINSIIRICDVTDYGTLTWLNFTTDKECHKRMCVFEISADSMVFNRIFFVAREIPK